MSILRYYSREQDARGGERGGGERGREERGRVENRIRKHSEF